jgi:hypothetical protein
MSRHYRTHPCFAGKEAVHCELKDHRTTPYQKPLWTPRIGNDEGPALTLALEFNGSKRYFLNLE